MSSEQVLLSLSFSIIIFDWETVKGTKERVPIHDGNIYEKRKAA